MPLSFDSRTLTIGELLNGDNIYHMPAFQRPYSWQTEQIAQLFEDLHTACFLKERRDNEFFLGPIVIASNKKQNINEVVDGQQRLVTLTTLLAILRDISSDQGLKDSIKKYLWREGDTLLTPEDLPRVQLKYSDQNFMQEFVQSDGGTRRLPDNASSAGTNNLLHAIQHMKTEIGPVQNEYAEKLSKYILQNCYVIKIESKDHDEAYRIFKSINTIGQPLTDLDLARGELVNPQHIDRSEAREIANLWDGITDEIGEDGLSSYIKTVLSTIDNEYGNDLLHESLRKIFSDPNRTNEFRQRLTNFLFTYQQLDSADLDFGTSSDAINRKIHRIKPFPFDHWRPLSLLFLARQPTARETLQFFSAMLGLCIGLTILKATQKSKLKKRFEAIEKRLHKGNILEDARSELYLTQTEKNNICRVLEQPIKHTERFVKPLLTQMNIEMQDTSIPPYFPAKITIEHILPQKPNAKSNWMKLFPDAATRQKLCHSLGNFTLLTQPINSGIRNKDFKDKRQGIFKKEGANTFAITTELNSYEDWNIEAIKERQEKLINIAKNIMQF